MVMAGLSGFVLMVFGLIALGLTQSPLPAGIPKEDYAKMIRLEWVIAILFMILGMGIVRFTIIKLTSQLAEVPTGDNHPTAGEPKKSNRFTKFLLVGVALGFCLAAGIVYSKAITPESFKEHEVAGWDAKSESAHTVVGTWNVTTNSRRWHFLIELLADGTYFGNGTTGKWTILSKDLIVLKQFKGKESLQLRILNQRHMDGGKDSFTFTR